MENLKAKAPISLNQILENLCKDAIKIALKSGNIEKYDEYLGKYAQLKRDELQRNYSKKF